MKNLTKILSLLLALATMMSLAACNKTTEGGEADPKASADLPKSVAEQTGFGYVASYDSLPENLNNVNSIFVKDGRYYIMGNSYSDVTFESTTYFFSMNPDGTDRQDIPLPKSEYNSSINYIKVDTEGNLYMLVYEYYYPEDDFDDEMPADEPVAEPAAADDEVSSEDTTDDETTADETADTDKMVVSTEVSADGMSVSTMKGTAAQMDNQSMERYSLYKCDPQGNLIFSKDLSELKANQEDYIWFNNLELDSDNNVYLNYDTNLFVLDKDGELLFKIEGDNYFDSLCATAGKVLCTYWGNNGMECCYVDVAGKKLGESIKFSEDNGYSYFSVYAGGDSGYDLLLNDNSCLYGFKTETSEKTVILNWLDCDVNGYNTDRVYPIDENSFLTMTWDDATGSQLMTTLVKTPVDQLPQRTTITYAFCYYLDYNLRGAILSFNRQNTQYHISTLDYSQYNTEADPTGGVTRLNNDIIAGSVPDIISADIDISSYINKGVLLDLYTLIDADTELSRDSFVDGILAASEVAGKLYTLGTSFYIQTTLGLSEVVGDESGWTFDEMMAAYSTLEDDAQIMRYMTRDSFLNYCIQMSYDSYIDQETGECHFNSDEFISLLEMSASFPKEYDYTDEEENYISDQTLMLQHKLLVAQFYLSGFGDMDYYRAYLNGKDFTFVGYPSSTRNGNMLQMDTKLAVSAKSQYTDGVWQFFKYLYSDEYQKNSIYQFSVMKSVFDKQKADAMKPYTYTDENGNEVEYENRWTLEDGTEIVLQPMTEAQIQKIMDCIQNSVPGGSIDETVMSIITEESASFFDGQKTAKDVADLIQNRVQTYVMENR